MYDIQARRTISDPATQRPAPNQPTPSPPSPAEIARAEALGHTLASLPSPDRHDIDYEAVAMREWPDDERIRKAFFLAALIIYNERSAAQNAEFEATPLDDEIV